MPIHHSIADQAPDEQVFMREISGWPGAVDKRLHAKIGAIQRHGASHIKIGISNNPVRRWREAYRRHGWRKMYVIYASSSHVHTCELERKMIERFKSGLMRSPSWYYNTTGGGGGKKPLSGPYYLYLVAAPKYARISRQLYE